MVVQSNPAGGLGLAASIASLVAACSQAGADLPIPVGYRALVESARASLVQNMEGFIKPGLSFREVRCFANGGYAVIFLEAGGAHPGQIDFALQGPGASAWAGGFGEESMVEEIAFNFDGIAVIDCPPR